jgi:hypothetical protein
VEEEADEDTAATAITLEETLGVNEHHHMDGVSPQSDEINGQGSQPAKC